jgi:hypothetical protein
LLQKLVTTDLKTATVKPNVGDINQTSKKANDAQNSCQESVTSGVTRYQKGYTAIAANETTVTLQSFVSALSTNLQSSSSDQKLRSQLAMAVFVFSYVSSAASEQMKSFGNNYTNVNLQIDWGPKSDVYFEKQFCCVNIGTDKGNQSKPFARFDSLEKFIKFMCDSLDQSCVNNQFVTVSANSFIPTVDSMYNYYKRVWPRIRNEQQQKDFETNQGKEVKAKISEALDKIGVLFPTAGIPFVSTTNQTTPNPATPNPTPTPLGQQVNPNLTPNAPDRTIFSNARIPSSGTIYVLRPSVLADGKLKVRGGIGPDLLSKDYEVDIYLIVLNGMGTEIKIGSSILKKGDNNINSFEFITPKSFTRELDTAAGSTTSNNSREVGFTFKIKEYPEYEFGTVKVVLPYECPGESYRIYDLVEESVYKSILEDPCGECYPNGTNGQEIILYGKKCT